MFSIREIGLLLLLMLAMPWLAFGQEKPDQARPDREAICRRLPCRPATTVKLKLNEKEYMEFEFPKGPYVAEGYINVLNGEEVRVEFEQTDHGLANPRYVDKTAKPESTVVFKLTHNEDQTILVVTNPFGRDIVYDCLIQHYKSARLQTTNVLPVRAKLMTYEAWPYPIPQVAISNVRFREK